MPPGAALLTGRRAIRGGVFDSIACADLAGPTERAFIPARRPRSSLSVVPVGVAASWEEAFSVPASMPGADSRVGAGALRRTLDSTDRERYG